MGLGSNLGCSPYRLLELGSRYVSYVNEYNVGSASLHFTEKSFYYVLVAMEEANSSTEAFALT